jgi:hypothetical protein
LRAISRLLAVLALAAATAAPAQEELDVAPAIVVAEKWLELLDRGAYGAGWEQAAPLFQEGMSRHRWETSLPNVRDGFGTVLRRKVRQATLATQLPNAPPGEYVVIQFDTAFEKRPLTTEIVTPMKDRDGQWRVAGYIIR